MSEANALPTSHGTEGGTHRVAPWVAATNRGRSGSLRRTAKMAEVSMTISVIHVQLYI